MVSSLTVDFYLFIFDADLVEGFVGVLLFFYLTASKSASKELEKCRTAIVFLRPKCDENMVVFFRSFFAN